MSDPRRPRRRAARPRREDLLPGLLALCLVPATGGALAQDLPAPGADPVALPAPTADWGLGRLRQGTGPGPWLAPFDLFDLPPGREPGGAPVRGWSLTPSLAVQGAVTDNVRNSRTDRQADAYVRINPTIAAAADTEELTGRLVYRPVARFNAVHSDQNRVDHFFSGQALATLVPDLFFLDARGSGDARSVLSDLALQDEVGSKDERVQTTRFQLSPYLLRRFGELATARVGYVYRGSAESGRSATLPGQTLPFFNGSGFTANEAYGILRSGEDWGRFAFEARSVGTFFEGDGIYSGAHRVTHALQGRYALTREIAVLAEGGYEDLRFNGVQPFVVQGGIWSAGIRIAPDPDSVLVLRYGRRDGHESFSANGNLAVGVRTRLFASYFDRIGSSALLQNDLLSSTVVDAEGNAVDASTGIPAPLAARTPFATSQSNLFRIRRGVVGIAQAWSRDSLSLTVFHEKRDPVAIAAGTTAFSQTVTSLGLSWSHGLTPTATLATLGRFGVTSQNGREGNNILIQASLSQTLTPTLVGSVLYRFSNTGTDGTLGRTMQNTLIVSLRQFF